MIIRLTVVLLFVIQSSIVIGQTLDEVRLAYDASSIKAVQVSFSASPDGKYFAIGFDNDTIKIFGVGERKFVRSFFCKSIGIESIRAKRSDVIWTMADKLLVIHSDTLTAYDTKDIGKSHFITLSSPASKTIYHAKRNMVLVSTNDGRITAYDASSLQFISKIEMNVFVGEVDLSVDPTGTLVAICGSESNSKGIIHKGFLPLRVYNIDSGSLVADLSKTETMPLALAFNEEGTLAVAGIWKFTLFDRSGFNVLKVVDSDKKTKIHYTDMLYTGNTIIADKLINRYDVYNTSNSEWLYSSLADQNIMQTFGNRHWPSIQIFNNYKNVSFSANGINITRIYDVKANSVVGYFYADGGKEYCFVSRDGRVDGTAVALNSVFWTSRKSSKKTLLDRTSEKSFAPKLLAQFLHGGEVSEKAFDIDENLSKTPELVVEKVNEIVSDKTNSFIAKAKKIAIEIAVRTNGDEINEIRLYQNSKLVRSLPRSSDNKYRFEATLVNVSDPLNYFYVTGTAANGIQPEKIRFTVRYEGKTEEKPKLYLITIGINQYKNPKYNLNYAEADANSIVDAILKRSPAIFSDVINYPIRNDKAVKQSIFEALGDIKSKALEQDVVLFYYAGHGVMDGANESEKQFYLVPHDVTQLYGKSELLAERGISAEDLRTYSQSINAQKQIFILDACQSSGALESLSVRGAAEEKAIALLARSTGTFWLASTGTNQFATEFATLGHGIFTHCLLEGYNGKADANKDQLLTVRELATYIENTVPDLAERLNGTPQYPSGYSYGNDFAITVLE